MNTNRSIYLFVFAALFAVALFVVQAVYADVNLPTRAREARADEADIQRWAAMGEYFSKLPASVVSNETKISQDADAARWQALGEAYRAIDLRTRQADTARWVAMGEYYSKQATSTASNGPKINRDTSSARWQALGEVYLATNLRTRQADAARWEAMGEYYSKHHK